jgi:hypothetical protein
VLSIGTPRGYPASIEDHAKEQPPTQRASKAITNVVGAAHLKPLFPRTYPSCFKIGAHLRFDHGDLAQCQGPLRGGVSNVVGCCRKNTGAWALSRQSTQHGLWIARFATHGSPTTASPSWEANRPYGQIRVRMVRRSAILESSHSHRRPRATFGIPIVEDCDHVASRQPIPKKAFAA